jgi:6-phosphogluconolactonase
VKSRFYAGCYTKPEGHVPNGCGEGVYTGELDLESGRITILDVVSGLVNPSFVNVDTEGNVLVVTEICEGPGEACIFSEGISGLELRSRQSTHGAASCHISADADRVYVASYMGGSLCAFDKNGSEIAEGILTHYEGTGPNAERQEAAHAHQAAVSPGGAHLYVCDLGSDKVWIHTLDGGPGEPVARLDTPPGSGPRHMAFHPTLPVAYVICELTGHVLVCSISDNGSLSIVDNVDTLPADCGHAPAAAAIKVHPSGNALYTSNRGHDSCTVYRIGDDGYLTNIDCFKCGGEQPRDMTVDPSGRWLLFANQDSDCITVFPLNQDTLTADPGAMQRFDCKTPTSIVFAAASDA